MLTCWCYLRLSWTNLKASWAKCFLILFFYRAPITVVWSYAIRGSKEIANGHYTMFLGIAYPKTNVVLLPTNWRCRKLYETHFSHALFVILAWYLFFVIDATGNVVQCLFSQQSHFSYDVAYDQYTNQFVWGPIHFVIGFRSKHCRQWRQIITLSLFISSGLHANVVDLVL